MQIQQTILIHVDCVELLFGVFVQLFFDISLIKLLSLFEVGLAVDLVILVGAAFRLCRQL